MLNAALPLPEREEKQTRICRMQPVGLGRQGSAAPSLRRMDSGPTGLGSMSNFGHSPHRIWVGPTP